MRIAIAGDSWGYVWTLRARDGGQEPGFETILRERGHTVNNLAKAGASNKEAFELLNRFKAPIDLVIFIQTEPIRDFWLPVVHPHPHEVDAERMFELARIHKGLVPAMRHHLKAGLYTSLAEFSQRRSIPVLLVGGCSLVRPKDVPAPLTVAVPSWTELLLGTEKYQDHIFQDTNQWLSKSYADLIIKKRDLDLIEDWYDVTKVVLDKKGMWMQSPKYFSPDKHHPNMLGHSVLADALEPFIQRYM